MGVFTALIWPAHGLLAILCMLHQKHCMSGGNNHARWMSTALVFSWLKCSAASYQLQSCGIGCSRRSSGKRCVCWLRCAFRKVPMSVQKCSRSLVHWRYVCMHYYKYKTIESMSISSLTKCSLNHRYLASLKISEWITGYPTLYPTMHAHCYLASFLS